LQHEYTICTEDIDGDKLGNIVGKLLTIDDGDVVVIVGFKDIADGDNVGFDVEIDDGE